MNDYVENAYDAQEYVFMTETEPSWMMRSIPANQ